jgi:hypothetical protein
MRGIRGTGTDRIYTQLIGIPLLIIFLVIFTLYIIYNLEYHPLYMKILLSIGSALFVIYGLIVIFMTGFETDAIYEKGISNQYTSLIDKIRGRTFQPFDSIIMIKYGKLDFPNYGKVDYIVPIDKYKGQILRPFINVKYRNPFFRVLIKHIKIKCPDAKWVFSRIEDIERK